METLKAQPNMNGTRERKTWCIPSENLMHRQDKGENLARGKLTAEKEREKKTFKLNLKCTKNQNVEKSKCIQWVCFLLSLESSWISRSENEWMLKELFVFCATIWVVYICEC